MVKVITYGTFDKLHYGHIRLLERAKALGDYLIVGITSDAYDIQRGKINVSENLIKRIENIKATNLCDEIIVEEYPGQKIDDIKRLGIDIFAIGSDWVGQFDYLNEYCKVVYLDRTKGVSSSQLRTLDNMRCTGIIDNGEHLSSIISQAHFVNGVEINCVYSDDKESYPNDINKITTVANDIDDFLKHIDSAFISGDIQTRYKYSLLCLENKKNVLCTMPPALTYNEYKDLKTYAEENDLSFIVSSSFRSSLAYKHLITLLKSRAIGKIQNMIINISSNPKSKYLSETLVSALIMAFEINGCNLKSYDRYLSSDNSYSRITLSFQNSFVLIQISEVLQNEDCVTIIGDEGMCKLHSPWETSGHIEISNIVNKKQSNLNYDGNGIKYELLSLIKNENNTISDEIVENIYKILF